MAETLTESFCERCGTRYTFESPRQRTRLKGVKVLSRGLKNFVLSDRTSIDEAMAAARSETDRDATAHQLDAFHKTFNFCMTCRQYTCPDCWNEAEASCLSCAPHPGHEIPVSPFLDLGATVVVSPAVSADASVPADVAPGDLAPGDVAPGDLAPGDVAPGDLAPAVGAPADLAPDAGLPVDLTPADITAESAAQTGGPLSRFRPGQSLDAELDAYERDHATDLIDPGADATGDPAAPVRSMPAEETVPGTEPVAAAAAFQPKDEGAASAATTTPAEVAPPLADIVAQPTWQRVAPDPMPVTPVTSPVAAPTSQPVADDTGATAEPAWPAKPEWPTLATPSANLPFFGRPAARQGGPDALWAETVHEMVAPATPVKAVGGVQPCVSCGLSLAATARFCRRCGTPQAS